MVYSYFKQLYNLFSFQLKVFLAIIILLSNHLYYLSPLVDDIQFVASIGFLIFVLYGVKGSLDPYIIGLCSEFILEENLADSLLELSSKMGSKIQTVKPIKYHSAFLWNNKFLFLGNEAKSVLSTKELEAVVAHEFSHEIRSKTHNWYLLLGIVIALLILIPIALNYSPDTSIIIRASNSSNPNSQRSINRFILILLEIFQTKPLC